MSRVRRGFKARRRRNRVLKMAKGYTFDRSTHYYQAAETVKRALKFAYVSRKLLKRDMRSLWIVRISAAVKGLGSSYSKFMGQIKAQNIQLNRKMLAEIASRDPEGFKAIFNTVNK